MAGPFSPPRRRERNLPTLFSLVTRRMKTAEYAKDAKDRRSCCGLCPRKSKIGCYQEVIKEMAFSAYSAPSYSAPSAVEFGFGFPQTLVRPEGMERLLVSLLPRYNPARFSP